LTNRQHEKLIIKIVNYIKRLSLRRRITVAILATFVVILPSVSLSLFYFSSLLEEINVIIEQDVKLGRMASDLSVTMLDIRRYERNYRIFGSSTERESVEKLVADAESVLKNAGEIVPVTEKDLVNELFDHLTIYSNSFSMLVEHISQNPPEDRIKRIRTRLSKSFSDFQSKYRDILTKLDEANAAERDSIIAYATKSMEALSLDRLINIETSSDQALQPLYIQENLDTSSQAFLDTAHSLAENSWENMLMHKNECLHIEARAKRNIISVLILTGIICIFMVTSLPRKIVRPITSLNQILKKAGEGDFKAQAQILTNDEIGDLARSYNLVIERLRLYDDLKTQKISSQKRILDRLLENLQSPVCILTADLSTFFYNTAFASIFGSSIPPRPPEGGLEIEKIEAMKDFVEKLHKNISTSANNFFLDVSGQDDTVFKLKGRCVRNADMELESVVIVGVSEEVQKVKR